MHEVLTWIVARTTEICDAVHADFFDPSIASLPVQQIGEQAS